MNSIFPFGLPFETSFYLTMFMSTLVLHVLFMNYVLAGSAWLAWAVLRGNVTLGARDYQSVSTEISTNASLLADWIPSMLSGAITAGVAPLLFVQILYQVEFYTANLLLFHRWMSILPVLIVGFYSLYILRTKWVESRSLAIRASIGMIPFVCVLFIAYSWTENHLLSLQGVNYWKEFYVDKRSFYFDVQILPRLLVWGIGSLPTLCVWLLWQLRHRQVVHRPIDPKAMKQLRSVALVGLFGSMLAGGGYSLLKTDNLQILFGWSGRIYLVLAIAGIGLQVVGWLRIPLHELISFRRAATITLGLLCTMSGLTACREIVRLNSIDAERLRALIEKHRMAYRVEGFWLFVLFAVINLGLIVWCFWSVRTGYRVPSISSPNSIEEGT